MSSPLFLKRTRDVPRNLFNAYPFTANPLRWPLPTLSLIRVVINILCPDDRVSIMTMILIGEGTVPQLLFGF